MRTTCRICGDDIEDHRIKKRNGGLCLACQRIKSNTETKKIAKYRKKNSAWGCF